MRTLLLIGLLCPGLLQGHPYLQARLHGTWQRTQLSLQAEVTLEEAQATDAAPPKRPASAKDLRASFERYAAHLASGIEVDIGGQALEPEVSVLELPSMQALAQDGPASKATYLFSVAIPSGVSGRLRLTQDLLKGKTDALGSPWVSNYHVLVADREHQRDLQGVLSPTQPFIADPAVPSTKLGLAWAYVREGVHHILTGYDHLLFISALTLAATSPLNLLAVVGMFTLAHTLTLVLAVLGYAHLSSSIVEPGIAASIVVVALLDLAGSRQGHGQDLLGWRRLGVAFGFGLFHGLGFAGGLLEAMQSMQGASQGLALLSFSAGVELGHLSVVLPLFFGLRYLRKKISASAGPAILRWGSLAIALAGSYYLFEALKGALA